MPFTSVLVTCNRLISHITNSSQTTFEECLSNFKLRLKARGYPNNFIERSLTGVRFEDRRLALQQRKKTQTKILPFVTTYHPAVRGLKEILMNNWVIIQNQPLLKNIYTKPPIISYKKGKSLKGTLVRAKIYFKAKMHRYHNSLGESVQACHNLLFSPVKFSRQCPVPG